MSTGRVMSSFRKIRGKPNTTPTEVPRAGVTLRELPDPPLLKGEEPEPTPAPAHRPQAFHDPSAPVQRNPMQRVVLGPGNFYTQDPATGEESLLGRTSGFTIEVQNDVTAPLSDIQEHIANEIARRAARNLDDSMMAGRATQYQEIADNAFDYSNYSRVASRINLQACHDWGSYVDRIEGRVSRQIERQGLEFFGSARAYEMTASMIEGFEGNMRFRSAPGTYSPAMAAVVAAHHYAVREGLGELVQSLEVMFRVTAWRFAFIFCPDGFPALCGVVNTNIGGGRTVIGGNMRNGHHYRPVEIGYGGEAEGDAVADFLYSAHTRANPAIGQFIRRRGR